MSGSSGSDTNRFFRGLFVWFIGVCLFAFTAAVIRAQGAIDYTGTGGKHTIEGRLYFPSGRKADSPGIKVTLESAEWQETLILEPGAERIVHIPTDQRRRVIPLNVAAAKGFRPADVDPKSEDVRYLGAWIETR